MKKFNPELQQLLIKLAQDANFYGKRIRDSKLTVVETIQSMKDEFKQFAQGELVDWLEANKPEKEKPKRAQSTKPAANTMTGNEKAMADNLPVLDGDRFLVVGVQNNTLPSSVFEQLLDLCTVCDAQLVLMPMYYNKNAFSATKESEDERFDDKFNEYLQLEDVYLFGRGGVRLCCEAAVPLTAKMPVNAAAQLNNGELFTVVSSPRQQMVTLPRLTNGKVKFAMSTGCATVYNYIRGRAGAEAEAEHVFGGWLFEYSNGTIKHTNISQGDDGKINLQTPIAAAVLGDLHCELFDPVIWGRTLEWLSVVRPPVVAVHDILHFSSRSHHNRHSGKHLYKSQGVTVQDELTQVISQLNELAAIVPTVYVVESNHNSALCNWLDDSSYNAKQDTCNSKIYYLLNWLVCDSIDESDEHKNALQVALENTNLANLPELAGNIVWGKMDEPFLCGGVDLSQHGHKGQNGSAGNPTLFKKWGINMITGHTHSPAMFGSATRGITTVGVTARLDQGYNRGGASSWSHGHALAHENGTRTFINIDPQEL